MKKKNTLKGIGVLYFSYYWVVVFFYFYNPKSNKIKTAPKESFDCFMTEHKTVLPLI